MNALPISMLTGFAWWMPACGEGCRAAVSIRLRAENPVMNQSQRSFEGVAAAGDLALPAAECFRLGDLLIDAGSGRVLRDGCEVPLSRLSYDLLLALARAAPATLSVDRLMDCVWPGLVVGPETISQRVKLLRDALGDDARHPRYIAGVRGRGYRLADVVQPDAERRHDVGSSKAVPLRSRRWWRPFWFVGAVGVAWALWLFAARPERSDPWPTTAAGGGAIAVLPFTVRAAEGEGPLFFADGIHDDLLTRLTRIPGLRVISRTSVMRYRDAGKSLRQISDELGVDTLLDGSVQQVGDQIRINAQLVDARSDAHLWAGTFDRRLTVSDLLAIQSEIAAAITESLRLVVDHEVSASAGATDNLQAYSENLMGQQAIAAFLDQGGNLGMLSVAEGHFRRAIELAPEFARAHAGLAQAVVHREWARSGGEGMNIERREAARAGAERALQLAPGLPDAHLALALYYNYGFRDYPQALEHIALAEHQLPGSVEIQLAKTWILLRRGQTEMALQSVQRAVASDPRNTLTLGNLGRVLWDLKRFDEADALIGRILKLDPGSESALRGRAMLPLLRSGDIGPIRDFHRLHPASGRLEWRWRVAFLARDWPAALAVLADRPNDSSGAGSEWPQLLQGLTLSCAGRPQSARIPLQQALGALQGKIARNPGVALNYALRGLALAGLGERDAAMASARRATDLLPLTHDAVVGYELLEIQAIVAAMVGDAAAAAALLDRLISAPGPNTIHLYRLDPRFDGIRDRPPFVALMKQHGQ